ncbi:immune inhibitor A domain-containing protein [Sinorhizobium psoraleae]|uniref:Immune inhibitor A n=1 Tax=Sinorhizobium psoraleae TaxID=520838 RepID=A0ABT4KA47_9HYPH|nr:immune inhibitor A domain-containing protein [Sinorhizobium psoraleae]MCZ4088723.1 immune inhibitor A [Sinorhizobium psoraleae]
MEFFSHEFGHAFGLPDLYDSQKPFTSSGIGTWGLMASGSWGGDNNHPETPSHMEAWSKEFLGWATVREIDTDTMQVKLRATIENNDAIRVDYGDAADPEDTRYLLLEYRKRQGFDSSLYADGLLVTEINNARVRSGLVTNGVNGEPLTWAST